eukprot:scaffold4343_cov144-Cylindrotheca_fusiformis.AAC.22
MQCHLYKEKWWLILVAFAVARGAEFAFEDDPGALDLFCNEHTQTSIALSMFEHSSPKGSSSYIQLYNMLSTFPNFFVDYFATVGNHHLFEDVAKNLSLLLEGFGLRRSHYHNDADTILTGTVFMNDFGLSMIQDPERGVLLVQTEQLCCSDFLGANVYRNLQACEFSSNCIIIDYSEHNYNWMAEELNVSSSVVLLPTLLQGRLDEYFRPHHLPSVWERNLDVSFFGTMTPRRKKVLDYIHDPNPNNPQWNIVMEQNHDKMRMAETYLHSKVCLTVHAFESSGPGEYHRLSEVAVSGCIPVMESFGESLAIDVYEACGGVIFADFQNLPNRIVDAVRGNDEEEEEEKMHRRVRWWRNRIQWEDLLRQAYHEEINQSEEL